MLRIYTDGVYDLFHRGHLESFKEIKKRHPHSKIIVGLISDVACSSYKRTPFIKQEDRYEILKAIRYIDEVIFPAPLIIEQDFIHEHHLDLIVHGFSNPADRQKQEEFFRIPIKLGIFQEIPYWSHESTTNIIHNINSNLRQ
jgi:choline-phosphate cytidylyltransferase